MDVHGSRGGGALLPLSFPSRARRNLIAVKQREFDVGSAPEITIPLSVISVSIGPRLSITSMPRSTTTILGQRPRSDDRVEPVLCQRLVSRSIRLVYQCFRRKTSVRAALIRGSRSTFPSTSSVPRIPGGVITCSSGPFSVTAARDWTGTERTFGVSCVQAVYDFMTKSKNRLLHP